MALALCGACGAGSGRVEVSCSPACPQGLVCSQSGCVAGDGLPAVDLAASAPDLAGSCGGVDCSGASPYCLAAACVPCLEDRHCPAGTLCVSIGSSRQCLAGCHDDRGCAAPAASCCGGRCIDAAVDSQNCGGCGSACSRAHASASCAAGRCVLLACSPGWADCNHDPGDGCEVNVTVDTDSCGQCGAGCHLAHARSACAFSCYLAACDFGWGDCNGVLADGCEASLLSDAMNCGACGSACGSAPHATLSCQNAACRISACAPGFADCDGEVKDGCEVATATDVLNCGACGNSCPQAQVCREGACTCKLCVIPHAQTRCVGQQCVFAGCLQGFADCNNNLQDGCEVDLRIDAANCGSCGNVCPQDAPACGDSMCGARVTVCDTPDEGGTAHIACPNNTTVKSIDFASYGTPSGMCGHFALGGCHAVNSQPIVEGACLGSASCSVDATNNVFGDPCFGTFKRLYIQATCG
jgi:hypothetical protein